MESFRVGTFNTFNLISPGIDYYRPDTAYSDDEFNDKTDWIARQLDEMRADIVGFQEVFRRDALRAALIKSRRLGSVAPVVPATREGEVPARTPAVALASRFEVLEARSITEIPADAQLSFPREFDADVSNVDPADTVALAISRFSRPVLRVRVRVTADLVVTVFVAHLKSKRPAYLSGESSSNPMHRTVAAARSLVLRAAESAGLRSLVVAETRGNRDPVIVLGDVNDGTLAVTTQMIAGESPYFRLRREQKQLYWDVLLYTAQQLQARESTRDTYFTHIFQGKFEALDHIMVSEEFYVRNPRRIGEVDYVQVFNDHLVDETQSQESIPRTRSDHGLVVAKINLR